MTTVSDLSDAERLILLTIRPLESVSRQAFHGKPFRLLERNLRSLASKLSFPEDVVLGLVSRGLLTVNQAAAEIPGRTARCPFSCILSRDGEKVRAKLIADRPAAWRAAANDAVPPSRAA